MPCLSTYTLKGIDTDCLANMAGIKELYLTYYGDVFPQIDYSSHTISAYTMTEGVEWTKYKFAKGTASLNSVLNTDSATRSRYYTHTITASFNRLQRETSLELQAMASERLVAVVVDNNNKAWYIGVGGYVISSNEEAGTGADTQNDRNGYTVVLEGRFNDMPYLFTADIDNPQPVPSGQTIDITSTSSITSSATQIQYVVEAPDDFTVKLEGPGETQYQYHTSGTVTDSFTISANTSTSAVQYVLTTWLTDSPSVSASTVVTQEPKPEPPAPVSKYVADLIAESYATYVTGNGGTYISILSACPYSASQIVDLQEVATNQKQLSAGTNNIIIWDQPKPSGWTDNDIADLYSGVSLNFTPRARMLWALGDIPSFEITFSGGAYQVNDYPWGSGGNNNGVFAPRFGSVSTGPDYFWKSPENVVVNFTGDYGTICQTMFAEMGTTTAITLSGGHFFSCVDWTGWFEDCYRLESITFDLMVRYDFTRLCHNMFKNCGSLTGVPYMVAWGRDHIQNTIFPHTQPGGSADCHGMFVGCDSLLTIGPTLNLANVSLCGCTVDDTQQAALSGILFGCPELTDVRIKNLGHNSWNFADTSTFTYIPKMDVASIEYLLNNVQDETGNNYTITFSTLHQGEISSTAISNAQSKGWTIAYQSAV